MRSEGIEVTDPLTGRQLVEKSYEYILKLTKECAKSLVDEFNATHRKFQPDSFHKEVSASIIQWFEKREKNVKLLLDSAGVMNQQPNVSHLKFKGSTRDAEFTMTGIATAFTLQGDQGKPLSFVKTLVFSVDKTNFARKKA